MTSLNLKLKVARNNIIKIIKDLSSFNNKKKPPIKEVAFPLRYLIKI